MFRWWWLALFCFGNAHAASPWGQAGATFLAAQQDLNAARWDAAQQRLQPLLAPQVPPAAPIPPLVRGQAHLLLASSALRQGEHTKGVPHIRETLRLYRQPLGLPPDESFEAMAGALHTATWLYAGAGLWPQALQAAQTGLQRSLRWTGAEGGAGGSNTLEFRKVLLSHALRQQRWGDAQAQVDALRRWLPLDAACVHAFCRDVQSDRLQLHKALGETEAAYALAQAIQRNPAPSPPERAVWNFVNLADLAEKLGRNTEALQWLDAALAAGAPPDSPPVQAAQTTRWDVLASTEGHSAAELATATAEVGALADRARQQHGVASAERGALLRLQSSLALRLGDTAAGSRLAAQALAIAWAADDPRLAWVAALRLADSAGPAGQLQAKIFYGKLAVNAAQTVRAGTLGLPAPRQQSFMADKREDFVELADTLLDARRLPEAEQLLAMAREDDFHQLVRSVEPRRQRLSFTAAEQPAAQVLATRRLALEQAGADWTRQLRPLGAPEQAVLHALESTVDALLAVQALPPAPEPLLPNPARPAQADGLCPHIYYLPTPDRLRIAVVHAGTTEVVDVPVTESTLLRHIADLRRVLQNPAADARPQAQALHALLWAPIAHLLPQATGSRVVVHPEGALRYLPFAALHDGTRWLVQIHALALNAGGGDTRVQSGTRTGWAVFGVSRGVAGLPPLPQVPGELAAIRHAGPAATHQALDAGFTAPRLQAALAQRSVVHIASHFVLVPGDSRASWLQLGGGERVSLAALAGDAYRFDGLDLLTLSACDTAVPPGVDAQGRSLDSLAWLAHARGAKNVLASLWPVPDGSTAALMGRFYQGLAAGQGKADALRAAQLALLAQPGPAGQPVRGLHAQPPITAGGAHPYYWGAFVLLAGSASTAIN